MAFPPSAGPGPVPFPSPAVLLLAAMLLLAGLVPVGVAGRALGAEDLPLPADHGPVLPLPIPTPGRLPRWRGFNLLEKFHLAWSNKPFVEEDFALIHDLGFNFVRLPMDYRTWIRDGDWTRFDERVLTEIDQAVAWGRTYGIHVDLCFHRAPGYTVASPPETRSLWTDAEAQRVCALHWATFARRYRGIPSANLSFDLMNEPAGVASASYAAVVRTLVAAIRAEDPDRLIISDGLEFGTRPCLDLAGLGVAQATRGYRPMEISHYQAGWIPGSDAMPTPAWPLVSGNGLLGGPDKPTQRGPLVITGPFPEAVRLRLRLGTVSAVGRLAVQADGRTLWERRFVCAGGPGEWRRSEYLERWRIWQGRFDRDYLIQVPAGTRSVTVANLEGDWLDLTELGLSPAAPAADPRPSGSQTAGAPGLPGGSLSSAGRPGEQVIALHPGWDQPHAPIRLEGPVGAWRLVADGAWDGPWLWREGIVPWQAAEAQGFGVMVGEFGAFNRTPHQVTLDWMEDCLANWQRAGWGWAMWNFRGSMGVLDSQRADVAYETWRGHRVDRRMLDLLRRY